MSLALGSVCRRSQHHAATRSPTEFACLEFKGIVGLRQIQPASPSWWRGSFSARELNRKRDVLQVCSSSRYVFQFCLFAANPRNSWNDDHSR